MIIIPAIDLRNGKCVRLTHGDENKQTVYSDHPIETAKYFMDEGARRLHIIDLDGAFEGRPRNLDWAIRIKEETGAFIQVGGGLRTMDALDLVLGTGIDRVILGTIVFEEAGLAQQAFQKYRDRIMVALDVKNGMVATRGWKGNSGFPVVEALEVVEKLGGKEIIFTDISRDGTLEGANIRGMQAVMAQTKMDVYASGGVTTLKDIESLKMINVPGCVVGKAIYEGHLKLSDAIQLASR